MTTNPEPKSRPQSRPSPGPQTEGGTLRPETQSKPISRSFLPFLGQRRRIVCDPGYQYRVITIPTLVAVSTVFLLMFALIRILVTTSTSVGASIGVLEGFVHPDTRLWYWAGMGAGVIFAVLLVYLELVGTHRSAGAVFQVRKTLNLITEGNLSRKVGLRTHDYFENLADDVNRMVEALQAEREQDLDTVREALDAIGHVRPEGQDEVSRNLGVVWEGLVRMKHRKEGHGG